MPLNAIELQRYLSACAEKADCRVVYEDKIQPRTDGETVYLPHVNMFTTDKFAQELIHFVNHEASHINFSAFEGVPEYKFMSPVYSILGLVWGILEDHRVDFLNDSEYQGDREITEEVHHPQVVKFCKQAVSSDPDLADKVISVTMMSQKLASKLYHRSADVVDVLEAISTPKAKAWCQKMFDLGIDQDLDMLAHTSHKLLGTRGTAAVAKDIWTRVFEEDVEEEMAKQKAIQDAIEAGAKKGDTIKIKKSDKGEGEGDGEEAGKGKGDGAEQAKGQGSTHGDGEPEKEKNEVAEEEIVIVDYEDFEPKLVHKVDPIMKKYKRGMTIKYPDKVSNADDYRQPDYKDYSVLDTINKDRSTGHYSESSGATAPWYRGDQVTSNREEIAADFASMKHDGFASQLRRLIQIRAAGRFQYGVERGKLHRGAIHRVTIPDNPIANKIFKHKTKSQVLNTCVSILVDCSGSMAGEKYRHAATAMLLLSKTLGNTLHIPIEIMGFTDAGYRDNASDIIIFRNFNEQMVSDDVMAERASAATAWMGGNADGESIVYALDRILQRKEKRKIMLVLSDGQPVGGRGDIRAYTKKIIHHIHESKAVDIVGIGIMSDEVKHYYPKHKVIQKAHEIEHELLTALRELMLKQ